LDENSKLCTAKGRMIDIYKTEKAKAPSGLCPAECTWNILEDYK
jgi:hypothetical protein